MYSRENFGQLSLVTAFPRRALVLECHSITSGSQNIVNENPEPAKVGWKKYGEEAGSGAGVAGKELGNGLRETAEETLLTYRRSSPITGADDSRGGLAGAFSSDSRQFLSFNTTCCM